LTRGLDLAASYLIDRIAGALQWEVLAQTTISAKSKNSIDEPNHPSRFQCELAPIGSCSFIGPLGNPD
jgi:hypothetical protein